MPHDYPANKRIDRHGIPWKSANSLSQPKEIFPWRRGEKKDLQPSGWRHSNKFGKFRSERDGERNFEGIARSTLSKKEKEETRGGLIASPLDGGRELENPRPHSTWTHGHHVLSVLIRNVISRWVKFWRETWPTRLIGPLRGSPTAAAPIKLGRGRYCDETCHHLDDPSKRGILFPLGRASKTGIKEK